MKVIQEDYTFIGNVTFLNVPKKVPTTLAPGNTTPNIIGAELVKAGGIIVTITNFLGASNGQTLRILGDGTTTIQNGTLIFTNTGANKLLAANKIYTFSYFDATHIWVENA